MFLNSLLFYVVFIISVLRVDGLFRKKQKKVNLDNSDLRPVTFRNPGNRLQNKNTKIQFGEDRVREFDKHDPPNRVGDRKKQKVRRPSRKNQKGRNQNLLRHEILLRRFTLSGKIWYHVWRKCKHYECYSRNNFAALYGKFLEEMNFYRRVHGSRPLKMDAILSRKAMDAAKKSAAIGRLVTNTYLDIGENSVVCEDKFAPLTVYKWYKEGSRHNYRTLAALPKSQHFSNLIWRSATKVGIGIARKENLLFIFFELWPETNEKFKFRQNVMKPKYNLANSKSLFRV